MDRSGVQKADKKVKQFATLLELGTGAQFDKDVVEAFFKAFDRGEIKNSLLKQGAL
jgi:hypothetical protein